MALNRSESWPTDEARLLEMSERQEEERERRARQTDPNVLLTDSGLPVPQYGVPDPPEEQPEHVARPKKRIPQHWVDVCPRHRMSKMTGGLTARVEYVSARMDQGERQVQCPDCRWWMFEDEL